MGKKVKAGNGKKVVSRMFDLEVDEVSAVDKPAIGEDFIVTKSVNGKGDTVKKKNVKKEEGKKPLPGAEDASAEATAQAGASAEGEQEDEAEGAEGAEGETTEDAGGEEGDESSDTDGEGEQAGGESTEADPAEGSEKRMTAMEGVAKQTTKSLAEMQETLEGLLELHDMAAGAMNAMLAMTVNAFQMCAGMMEMGEAEMVEAQVKSLADIKKTLGESQVEVQKAGAKISSSRLAVLQEIATKLTSLLAEVQAAAKEGKKGGKKKSEDMEAVEKRASDLEGQLKAANDELKTTKEDVTKLANRLNELETSAGASSAVEGDEDDSESSSNQTQTKSVFSGLIPLDEIKKRNAARAEFLKSGGKVAEKKD